jgi:hypothetical protein
VTCALYGGFCSFWLYSSKLMKSFRFKKVLHGTNGLFFFVFCCVNIKVWKATGEASNEIPSIPFFNKYRTEVYVGFHLHDILVIFI